MINENSYTVSPKPYVRIILVDRTDAEAKSGLHASGEGERVPGPEPW